jgi:transposase
MEKIRCVGLDVHEQSIVLAIAEPDGSAPMVLGRMPHDIGALVKRLKALAHSGPVRVAYETGACGVGLWRRLNEEGIECFVVAASRVPKDGRPKTDNEDAIRLARFLRSGDLVSVYVPDKETEALRALTRAREDAIEAQQRARGGLRAFLVQQGLRFEGKSNWTKEHYRWIAALKFTHPSLEIVRDDYLREVQAVECLIVRLTKDIEVLAPQSSHAPLIEALQSLRGVQLVTAATLAFEVGNFGRFAKAKHLMSYLGLVPREMSSGERTVKGAITKAGNSHVRRVLCEAAWNYRYPGTGAAIRKRRDKTPPRVQDIAARAQERLHERYKRLCIRKKELNKVNVAISRELVGFIWAIGQEVERNDTKH